jgi:hypothetical protein
MGAYDRETCVFGCEVTIFAGMASIHSTWFEPYEKSMLNGPRDT